MRVAVAADHAGFAYKAPMISALKTDGHEVTDLGTDSDAPADYPDFARAIGLAVREGRADAGVLICGSGAGVSIAANKMRGVRAALCHDVFTARQSREDDDANVLCLGARVIELDFAITLARTFLGAHFSGAERHRRRLEKVLALERAEIGDDDASAEAALAHLESIDAAKRLWAEDPTLWSTDPAVRAAIANRLGWLRAPEAMRSQVADLQRFAADVRADGITDVVLLGMGGSSLAPEVLQAACGTAPGHPALTVLDSTDPGQIRATLSRLTLARTLFVVTSKSGTTTEMMTLYKFFRAQLEKTIDGHGPSRSSGEGPSAGSHFVAITDPGTPLEKLAGESGFRRTFINDPRIGGRFSALSYFGLVPAALVGVDVARLLERTAAMAARCGPEIPVRENPGLRLGATLGGLAQGGRDKVTLLLSPGLRALGAWLEQLVTESTGKLGRGLVVVNDEPPGPPDVYGNDRVFVAMNLGGDTTPEAAASTLAAAGHPVVRLSLDEPYDVGAEFFRWEIATAAAGIVLGLNPFDEPNVAQAKDATNGALARFLETGRLPEWPTDSVDDLARVLKDARPGDYVGLLAYLTPTPQTTAALQRMRVMLRDATRLATTLGYGPRYLHSTGQVHKGGPPTPILVIFTTTQEDLPIPGERYGFATLQMAQALGDLATLRAAQRRVLWLPLEGAPADALTRIAAALERQQVR